MCWIADLQNHFVRASSLSDFADEGKRKDMNASLFFGSVSEEGLAWGGFRPIWAKKEKGLDPCRYFVGEGEKGLSSQRLPIKEIGCRANIDVLKGERRELFRMVIFPREKKKGDGAPWLLPGWLWDGKGKKKETSTTLSKKKKGGS